MRPTGNAVFGAVLLALTVSIFAYLAVSHAQPSQNGSAELSGAILGNQSLSTNGTLAVNESLQREYALYTLEMKRMGRKAIPQNMTFSESNRTGPQTLPGIVPPENESFNQSVQSEYALEMERLKSLEAITPNMTFAEPVPPAPPNPDNASGPLNMPFVEPVPPAPPNPDNAPGPPNITFPELVSPAPPNPDNGSGAPAPQGNEPALSETDSGADYGVMNNDPSVNCPIISAPGTYVMPMDYTGAPNSASPFISDTSCVSIISSNVAFDCAGHSITTAGYTQTFGILLAMVNNVTVENCNILNYSISIVEYNSTNSSILNNSVIHSFSYNIWLDSSNNSLVSNNTVDKSYYGITLDSSNNNILSNNRILTNSILSYYTYYDYPYEGVMLVSSNNNTLYGDVVYNYSNGIYLINSSQNTFYNNTIHNNNGAGVYLDSSCNNNTMHDNNLYMNEEEFYLGGIQNTLYNNNAHDSAATMYGGLAFYILATTASQIAIYNNSIHNEAYGIDAYSVNQSVFYNNNIYSIHSNAISFGQDSSNNSVYNNSISNTADGISFGARSDNNNVSFNSISDTTVGTGLVMGSDNNIVYNNTFNNNNQGGISMSGSNNVIHDNLIENDTNPYTFPYSAMTYGHGIFFGGGGFNNSIYNNRLSNDYYGIVISVSNGINVSNNVADNCLNSGIYVSGIDISNNVTLYNNTADNNRYYGIVVTSQTNNTLSNNVAENNAFVGIALFRISGPDYPPPSGNTLSNNRADNNVNVGIQVVYGDNNALYNNSADSNTYTGIQLGYGDNDTMSNNSADNNGYYGIDIISEDNSTMSNNSADNNYAGIILDSSNNNTLSNNSAESNSYVGIWLGASDRNNLFDNNADNNYLAGVYLYYSDNNSLSNISAASNLIDGVTISHSDNNSLSNISTHNNWGDGVYALSSSNNVLSNINADNNSGIGFEFRSSCNNNALSNSSADYNGGGIWFFDSSDNNTLSNISADNNSNNGITLQWSSQNTLYNNTVMENGDLDLFVIPLSPDDCQNNITNTTGSAYRPIYYSSDPVSWESLDAAEIQLCNATGSNVTNTHVNGSDTLYNDGFIIFYTNNATIVNASSSDNAFGFLIQWSDNGTYLNDSANNNGNPGFGTGNGFYVSNSNGLDFAKTSSIGNYYNGFYVELSDSSNISDSSASGNRQYGYVFYNSNSGNMVNDSATGSIGGFYLDFAVDNNITNCTASGNSAWAFTSADGSQGNLVQNLTLGHDMVSFESKDININDSVHPLGYGGGSPSVEVHIYSSDAYDPKVTGISDGPAGNRDITSFGPTSDDYNGSVAYTPTPDEGAVAATIPTGITPVSDITDPQIFYGDDDLSDDITLPFNVTLFGRQNDHIRISTNGFIYLSNETVVSTDTACCSQDFMSSQYITQGSDYLVAGLWADLITDGVDSNITYGVTGTAPNRVYIISYDHAAEYDSYLTSGNDTFQIKLLENGTNTSAISSAPDPLGLADINRFVQATANSYDSFLFLNFSYLPADVQSLNVSTLFMAKYESNGWITNSTLFSSVDGVDTSSGYVFANITNFGSIFAPLGAATYTPPPPPPPPPSPPPSGWGGGVSATPLLKPPLSISFSRAPCPADQVTITASSGAGTLIKLLLTSPDNAMVDEKTAGSDGTATFSLTEGGTYEADASNSNYGSGKTKFTFSTCAPPGSQLCTSDADCPMTDFCNLAIGACQPVQGACGFADNHTWYKYQCCADADCPPSNVCVVHTCEFVNLTGDKEGLVGWQGLVKATVGGKPFANATLDILLPDGTSFRAVTGANGWYSIPFAFEGNYTVRLVRAGVFVKTHLIAVALPPSATPTTRPVVVEQPVNYCWALPIIIAMILAYLLYRKWRAGKGRKK